MNSELRHHSSPSGIVIAETSLLPLSPKDKLNAYAAAIEISTILQRPAFDLLTGHICTFKREEKTCLGLVWTYDPAPYILGRPFIRLPMYFYSRSVCSAYFAVGTHVTLAAISPLTHLIELVKLNLSSRRQRIKMVVHIIKLLLHHMIQALRTATGTRDFEEFSLVVRP
jgi:hypothetical protein